MKNIKLKDELNLIPNDTVIVVEDRSIMTNSQYKIVFYGKRFDFVNADACQERYEEYKNREIDYIDVHNDYNELGEIIIICRGK